MSENGKPEPPWWHGFPSLFSSGLFALAGVLAGTAALLLCVFLAVGKLPVATAVPWILGVGALSPLLFHLHRRAERHAGIPGGPSSLGHLTVVPDRRRSIVVQFILGNEDGTLMRDGDTLVLRTRHTRHWPLPLAYMMFLHKMDEPGSARWLFLIWYGFVFADLLLSLLLKSIQRLPRGGITSVVLCGDYLVLRLAGSPEPEPLVLRIERFKRERAKDMLSQFAPFEELPEPRPPRVLKAPRTPPSPRQAPPPSTAIDAAKEAALDRALRDLKQAKP